MAQGGDKHFPHRTEVEVALKGRLEAGRIPTGRGALQFAMTPGFAIVPHLHRGKVGGKPLANAGESPPWAKLHLQDAGGLEQSVSVVLSTTRLA